MDRRNFLISTAGLTVLPAGLDMSFLGAAKAADNRLVAFVHTQAAGDNGPVDSMLARLNELKTKYGVTTRDIYAQDPATYNSIFRTLGTAGASVVATAFPQVTEAVKAAAPMFPKTKFVHLFADPIEPPIPNLVTVSYDYYLGCYLSGLFGATISKSGKLGHIQGAAQPPLIADFNAMKAGAAAATRPAEVTSAVAGSFQDPAKGREIANQMYQSGIDYIQTDSAATDSGVIQAANEGPGRLVSAISEAQYKLGPKTIVSLVKLDFGLSLYLQIESALGPDFKAGHIKSGLNDGVVDFVLSPTFLEQGDADTATRAKAAWPVIEDAKKRIVAGTLQVPFITKA
jgi:basic membrane protein A